MSGEGSTDEAVVYARATENKPKKEKLNIPCEIEVIKRKVPEENVNSDGDSSGNKKWKPYSTPISEKNFYKAYS